jgi:hypothetical protein
VFTKQTLYKSEVGKKDRIVRKSSSGKERIFKEE